MPDFQTSVSTDAAGAVSITVTGDLDLASANQFVEAARANFNGRTGVRLVVDLGGVAFVDSTGLGALIKVRKELQDAGGRFVISEHSRAVARAAEYAGLSDVLGLSR